MSNLTTSWKHSKKKFLLKTTTYKYLFLQMYVLPNSVQRDQGSLPTLCSWVVWAQWLGVPGYKQYLLYFVWSMIIRGHWKTCSWHFLSGERIIIHDFHCIMNIVIIQPDTIFQIFYHRGQKDCTEAKLPALHTSDLGWPPEPYMIHYTPVGVIPEYKLKGKFWSS